MSPVAAGAAAASALASSATAGASARAVSCGNTGKAAQRQEGEIEVKLRAKLSQVERLNQHQAARLAKQSQELDALRAELLILRRSTAPEAPADPNQMAHEEAGEHSEREEDIKTLRAERDYYQQQFEEMTKFLEDYGLTWVGDNRIETSEVSLPDTEGKAVKSGPDGICTSPSASSKGKMTVDIQAIAASVKALNATVQKEGARVVSDRFGGAVHARLVADDALPLPLTFFQDGVKLGGCKFQQYEQDGVQQLIKDILDGYFPFALKDDYPEGVNLRVVDRTTRKFEEWLRESAQSGDPELVDGGSRLCPAGGRPLRAPSRTHGIATVSGDAVTAGKVVRAGEICEITPARASLGTAVASRGCSAPPPANGEVTLLSPSRDACAPAVRLQVRLGHGERLVLLMEPSATIGAVEGAVEQWLAEQQPGIERDKTEQLVLRTAFPPKAYTDREQTLFEAGLIPSATLFVGGSMTQGVAECP